MSVLKSQRGESDVAFLDVARRLEVHTLEQCLKLPKRLTFFLSTEIMRWGSDVYNNVKAANSIYATNQHEAQMRRDHFTEANNALQILDGKIGLLYEMLIMNPEHFGANPRDQTNGKRRLENAVKAWAALINEEAALISKIKKSDKARYKDLP